jgi:hypothetical protein
LADYALLLLLYCRAVLKRTLQLRGCYPTRKPTARLQLLSLTPCLLLRG